MKKKKRKNKIRNTIVLIMIKHCKNGLMKNKKDKRKNGKNSQEEWLLEDDYV